MLAQLSTPNASGSSASTANQTLTATTAGAPGAGTTGPNGSTPAAPTGSANPIATTTVNGAAVPLSTFSHFETRNAPLAVTHQGQFPAVTISFNLAPNGSLGEATKAFEQAQRDMGMPLSIQSAFQGTAASFQASLSNEPLLILAAQIGRAHV